MLTSSVTVSLAANGRAQTAKQRSKDRGEALGSSTEQRTAREAEKHLCV